MPGSELKFKSPHSHNVYRASHSSLGEIRSFSPKEKKFFLNTEGELPEGRDCVLLTAVSPDLSKSGMMYDCHYLWLLKRQLGNVYLADTKNVTMITPLLLSRVAIHCPGTTNQQHLCTTDVPWAQASDSTEKTSSFRDLPGLN